MSSIGRRRMVAIYLSMDFIMIKQLGYENETLDLCVELWRGILSLFTDETASSL